MYNIHQERKREKAFPTLRTEHRTSGELVSPASSITSFFKKSVMIAGGRSSQHLARILQTPRVALERTVGWGSSRRPWGSQICGCNHMVQQWILIIFCSFLIYIFLRFGRCSPLLCPTAFEWSHLYSCCSDLDHGLGRPQWRAKSHLHAPQSLEPEEIKQKHIRPTTILKYEYECSEKSVSVHSKLSRELACRDYGASCPPCYSPSLSGNGSRSAYESKEIWG